MKPETVFRQSKVIPFLKTLKNTAYFPIQQASIVGDPDFLLCICGRFVALELKSDEGVLSDLQRYNLQYIRNRGQGKAFVAEPKTWDSIKEILTKLSEGEHIDDEN